VRNTIHGVLFPDIDEGFALRVLTWLTMVLFVLFFMATGVLDALRQFLAGFIMLLADILLLSCMVLCATHFGL
jgi:hypothetical protein